MRMKLPKCYLVYILITLDTVTFIFGFERK